MSYIGQAKDYGNRTFVGDKLVANSITTTESGGAVYGSYVSLKFSDSAFTGNSAKYGGAIYNTTAGTNGTDGQFSLTGSTFTGNKATASGGALYVLYDEQTISDSTFTGNTATKEGGAIYFNGGTTTITGSTFTGNAAGSFGGAIRTTKDNILTLTGSVFSGNTANQGGAVINYGTTSISGSTFTGNTAKFGGAVYGNVGMLTIRDSVFATVSDTIDNSSGTLTLGGTITTAAQIVSDNAINFETGTLLAFDISGYTAGNTTSLLGNYDTAFANNANFSITLNVASAQNNGAYLFAANAAAFDKAVTVKCGGNTIGTFASAGSSFTYNDRTYQLALNSTDLLLTIKDKPKFERIVVENGQTKTLSGGSYTNPTPYAGEGGALQVKAGGTLIVKDSAVFTGNTAANGGAVVNAGTASISGSTFSGNEAGTYGGAIKNDGMATINASIFSKNMAGLYGGAVANFGTASISGSTFTSNTAGKTGGAVYNYNKDSMTITDSVFTGNTAEMYGGAVANSNEGSMTITGSTFSGNAAGRFGGAICNSGGALTIRDSVFATESDTIYSQSGNMTLGGTITTAAQINSTKAITFEEGTKLVLDISVYAAGNTTSLLGNYDTAFANNANFSITVNAANNQAKDTYIIADNAAGFSKSITVVCGAESKTLGLNGTVTVNSLNYSLMSDAKNNVVLTIAEPPPFARTVVENGQTKTLSGGSYTNPAPYAGNGGAAEVKEGGTLIVKDSAVFTGNTAAKGGAVYINGGTATVSGSTFTDNKAATGGAVYGGTASDTTITRSTFTGNAVGNLGGAVYHNGTALIENSVFSGNTATYGGAVLSGDLSETLISGSSFSGNTATYGGAVYNSNNMTVGNSVFDGNVATDGGALYNEDHELNVSGSTFTGNTANNGGAIYGGTASKTTITDSVFTDNRATNGGAIDINGGTATITGSTFSGNTAGVYGGAIYNNGGARALTIRNSVFATESDTIYSQSGNMTLGGTITTAAQIFSDNAITVEADTSLVLDLTSYTEGNTVSILGNYDTAFAKAEDNFTLSVKVTADQATGNYILADTASGFGETVTVVCDGVTVGTLAIGETVKNYALALDGSNNVVLSVSETPVANLVLGDNGEVRYRTGDKLTTVTDVLWGTGDWKVVDQGKFTAGGLTDVLMSYDNGTVTSVAALKNSGSQKNPVLAGDAHTDIRGFENSDWEFFGVADVNGDGVDDIVTVETASHAGTYDRSVNSWIMGTDGTYQSDKRLGGMNSEWNLVGFADMDGNGSKDAVLQNSASGLVGYWQQGDNGETLIDISSADNWWTLTGIGDFDGDGIGDILLKGQDGNFATWTEFNHSDRGHVTHTDLGALDGDYAFLRSMDVDMDGEDEIVWKASDGSLAWNKADTQEHFADITHLA